MDSPTGSRSKTVRFDPHDTQYTYDREPSSSPTPSEAHPEVSVGTPNSHSPPTWVLSTPSPTHSVSTVDTEGPHTPPSAGPSNMYHSYEVKEPPSRRGSPPEQNYPGRVWPHPLVVNAPVPWDVADRPTSAVIPDLKVYGEEECIISNPSQTPYIQIIHPNLRSWPLQIDLRRRHPLKLEEIYMMIYDHLNEPLINIDLPKLSQGKAIYDAFVKRCKAQRIDPRQDAIRRIDFAAGRRIFYGLREVDEDPLNWELVMLPEAVS